ncbi:hypothetical protein WA158_003238 [Blastocystis sp. Blastoise]
MTKSQRLDLLVHVLSCPICLDYIKESQVSKMCMHRFCKDCIQKSLRKSGAICPFCRIKIPTRRHLRDDEKFDQIIQIVKKHLYPVESKNQKFHMEAKSNIQYIRDYITDTLLPTNDIWAPFIFLFFAQGEDHQLIQIDDESLTLKQIAQIYPDTDGAIILFISPQL